MCIQCTVVANILHGGACIWLSIATDLICFLGAGNRLIGGACIWVGIATDLICFLGAGDKLVAYDVLYLTIPKIYTIGGDHVFFHREFEKTFRKRKFWWEFCYGMLHWWGDLADTACMMGFHKSCTRDSLPAWPMILCAVCWMVMQLAQ